MRRALFVIVAVLSGFAITPVAADDAPGLVPVNHDGFETGDYRNWLPKYRGNSDEWVRPQFAVSDADPISGEYSLRWSGGTDEVAAWLLTSNAFYLRRPFTARVDFRVDAFPDSPAVWVGLHALETYDKQAGVRAMLREPDLEAGRVYTLMLRLDEDGRTLTRVLDAETQRVLSEGEGETSVHPHGLAIEVYLPGGEAAEIAFDDVRVDAAPYRVPEKTWTRAPLPHYVLLPRQGDVTQEEGNWVGAHGLFHDDDGYHMWYRIRNNEQRGAGYGYAHSDDGLTWEKYEDNPIITIDRERFSSNENIAVRRVHGKYRAWYTVDLIDEPGWRTYYAESDDGITWDEHGIVIPEPPNKDADVVHVDGTYYLYAIGPDNTSFSVFTSDDGIEWEHRNTIPMRVHRHPTIYYDPETKKFWLYAFGSHLGVHRAWSKDGIAFSDFAYVWSEPPVGVDDWREGGVDYAQFRSDAQGHLLDTHRNLIMIYQGRNNKANNHPGWLYHGSERILMAGYFSGLHVEVPTRVGPDRPLEYERFPYDAEAAEGLSVQASSPGRVTVLDWSPHEDTVAELDLRGDVGRWRFEVQDALEPGETYELVRRRMAGGSGPPQQDRTDLIERGEAGAFGDATFTMEGERRTRLRLLIRRVTD